MINKQYFKISDALHDFVEEVLADLKVTINNADENDSSYEIPLPNKTSDKWRVLVENFIHENINEGIVGIGIKFEEME